MSAGTNRRHPCAGCDRERLVHAIKTGSACIACGTITPYADVVAARQAAIDWAAVDWVCQGSRIPKLSGVERRMIVRRMSSRLTSPADNHTDLLPWQITAERLGERMGVTAAAVQQIVCRLPKATRHVCPECRGDMWVIDATGVVEEHGDSYHERCGMSGREWRGLAAVRPDLYRRAVSA